LTEFRGLPHLITVDQGPEAWRIEYVGRTTRSTMESFFSSRRRKQPTAGRAIRQELSPDQFEKTQATLGECP